MQIPIKSYTLKNSKGLSIQFLNYGGKLQAAKFTQNKEEIDVLLGYQSPEEYLKGDGYLGAICGRVANRISNASFSLGEKTYRLNKNDGSNILHGGTEGFHTQYFDVNAIKKEGYTQAYKLSYVSKDGEAGFPGKLAVEVIYALNNEDEFLIDLQATTDKPTLVNLTSHPYFNLNGAGLGTVHQHQLMVNASNYLPLENDHAPSGEIASVDGTPFDFREEKELDTGLSMAHPQTTFIGGYDHYWVLDKDPEKNHMACRLSLPEKNRAIEVFTSNPGLQIYTANHFDGTRMAKNNTPITAFGGLAIEAHGFPDAPNKSNFPGIELNPKETYKQQIIYRFVY